MKNSLKRYQNGLASFQNRTSSSCFTGLDRGDKGWCISSAEAGIIRLGSDGGGWRCSSHSSAVGWESAVTVITDNDETDAQRRAARRRTGSSSSVSAWPRPHRSLWGFHSSFLLRVLVQGREKSLQVRLQQGSVCSRHLRGVLGKLGPPHRPGGNGQKAKVTLSCQPS